jgi:hypothetical protein
MCYAGMSKSRSLKLVVRGPESTGYRVEAVSVEQLQDVWHPMEWGGSVEVCTTKRILDPLGRHHKTTQCVLGTLTWHSLRATHHHTLIF